MEIITLDFYRSAIGYFRNAISKNSRREEIAKHLLPALISVSASTVGVVESEKICFKAVEMADCLIEILDGGDFR